MVGLFFFIIILCVCVCAITMDIIFEILELSASSCSSTLTGTMDCASSCTSTLTGTMDCVRVVKKL